MKEAIIGLVITALVITSMGLIFWEVDQYSQQKAPTLPIGATQIEQRGLNWYEFSYKGNRVLYHSHGRRTAMVVIEGAE